MNLDALCPTATQRIVAAHARDALQRCADIFEAEEVDGAAEPILATLAETYGLCRFPGESPTRLRDRLRDLLSSHADAQERPPPLLAEAQAIEQARAQIQRRPIPPSVKIEKVGHLSGRVRSPHADENGWLHQLGKAFGTRSTAVVDAFVAMLDDLTDSQHMSETRLNAALAIIAGAKPRNEIQAALCAQMVALNWLMMEASARCFWSFHPETASAAARLNKAFSQSAETLAKLQGRVSHQKIAVKVERHEHKHMHLHHEGGSSDFQSQPHEPTRSRRARGLRSPDRIEAHQHPQGYPLHGADTTRDTVPVPGRARS